MNPSRNSTFFTFLLILPLTVLLSCSRQPQLEETSLNINEVYEQASFDARVRTFYEDGSPKLNVAFSVFYQSLSFNMKEGELTANGEFSVNVYAGRSSGGELIHSDTFPYTIVAGSSDEANSFRRFLSSLNILLDDMYRDLYIIVSNVDHQTGFTVSKEYQSGFPSGSEATAISDLLLSTIEDGVLNPFPSRQVATAADTLSIAFFVRDMNATSYNVTVRIERIRTDTTHAQLLGIPLQNRSLYERGIDLNNTTPVYTFQGSSATGETQSFSFPFKKPPMGVYRFTASVYVDGQETPVSSKSETIIVRSPNFPAVASIEEMARPLAYLMKESEYKAMMKLTDPEEMRRTVDLFWLENLGDTRSATEAMQIFYGNVEDANLLFSNFKEGWKTDMGKVYVLFGAPVFTQRSVNRNFWFYTITRSPAYTFVFYRPNTFDPRLPYDHFVLQRRRLYDEVEYRRVQDWLNGNIFYRP